MGNETGRESDATITATGEDPKLTGGTGDPPKKRKSKAIKHTEFTEVETYIRDGRGRPMSRSVSLRTFDPSLLGSESSSTSSTSSISSTTSSTTAAGKSGSRTKWWSPKRKKGSKKRSKAGMSDLSSIRSSAASVASAGRQTTGGLVSRGPGGTTVGTRASALSSTSSLDSDSEMGSVGSGSGGADFVRMALKPDASQSGDEDSYSGPKHRPGAASEIVVSRSRTMPGKVGTPDATAASIKVTHSSIGVQRTTVTKGMAVYDDDEDEDEGDDSLTQSKTTPASSMAAGGTGDPRLSGRSGGGHRSSHYRKKKGHSTTMDLGRSATMRDGGSTGSSSVSSSKKLGVSGESQTTGVSGSSSVVKSTQPMMKKELTPEEKQFKRELRKVVEKLNTFEEQLPISDSILLRILSFTKPLEQLHLCLVSKEFRYFIYYKKLIPGLKHQSSIKYFYDRYSVYYDLRRRSFKFNLTDSLDIPVNCRMKSKGDKKRFDGITSAGSSYFLKRSITEKSMTAGVGDSPIGSMRITTKDDSGDITMLGRYKKGGSSKLVGMGAMVEGSLGGMLPMSRAATMNELKSGGSVTPEPGGVFGSFKSSGSNTISLVSSAEMNDDSDVIEQQSERRRSSKKTKKNRVMFDMSVGSTDSSSAGIHSVAPDAEMLDLPMYGTRHVKSHTIDIAPSPPVAGSDGDDSLPKSTALETRASLADMAALASAEKLSEDRAGVTDDDEDGESGMLPPKQRMSKSKPSVELPDSALIISTQPGPEVQLSPTESPATGGSSGTADSTLSFSVTDATAKSVGGLPTKPGLSVPPTGQLSPGHGGSVSANLDDFTFVSNSPPLHGSPKVSDGAASSDDDEPIAPFASVAKTKTIGSSSIASTEGSVVYIDSDADGGSRPPSPVRLKPSLTAESKSDAASESSMPSPTPSKGREKSPDIPPASIDDPKVEPVTPVPSTIETSKPIATLTDTPSHSATAPSTPVAASERKRGSSKRSRLSAKVKIGTTSKAALNETRRRFKENFEQTFDTLDRIEVAWLTYAKSRPVGWLASVLVSPFSRITRLDFSGSILTEKDIIDLFETLEKRLGPSPITDLNFMGNRKLNDHTAPAMKSCIQKKMPYLKTLYMDYTGVSNGTCEELYKLYLESEYLSDKKSELKALSSGLPSTKLINRMSGVHQTKPKVDSEDRKGESDEGSSDSDSGSSSSTDPDSKPLIRLKKISMEGTKVEIDGVKYLDRIFTEGLVNEKDKVSIKLKLEWNGVSHPERKKFKAQCDPRVKFY